MALLRKLQTVHDKSQSERSKPVRLSGRKRGAAAMTAHFPDDAADRQVAAPSSRGPSCSARPASVEGGTPHALEAWRSCRHPI